MPIEIRKISFSEAELSDAIARFAKDAKRAMPSGKIVGCTVGANGGGLMVSMTVTNSADGASGTVQFDHATVAAALIHYCREKKIPLSKAAEKSVEAEGTGVVLTLRIPD